MRTLGFYQPFCSLMIHGKLETRWVREGFKPPFPLGEYLYYSTSKRCTQATLFDWCGPEIMLNISDTLKEDVTAKLDKCAIGSGELINLRPMVKEDEQRAFVKFIGRQIRIVKDKEGNTKEVPYIQWVLEFKDSAYIIPFQWKFGKQGVGKVTDSEMHKIIY